MNKVVSKIKEDIKYWELSELSEVLGVVNKEIDRSVEAWFGNKYVAKEDVIKTMRTYLTENKEKEDNWDSIYTLVECLCNAAIYTGNIKYYPLRAIEKLKDKTSELSVEELFMKELKLYFKRYMDDGYYTAYLNGGTKEIQRCSIAVQEVNVAITEIKSTGFLLKYL